MRERRRLRRLLEALKRLSLPEHEPIQWMPTEDGEFIGFPPETQITDIALVAIHPRLPEDARIKILRSWENELWDLVASYRERYSHLSGSKP